MKLPVGLWNLFLRLSVKPILGAPVSVQTKRRLLDGMSRLTIGVPPFTCVLQDPAHDGVPAMTWIANGRVRPDKVVLFLHGGAYVLGSPGMYVGMLARISREAGIGFYAPDYRLAPEHPFPAQIEDALASWRELRGRGYAAGDIVIGGDSAGAGLALALLAELCAMDERPAGAFALSPWTDLTGSGRSVQENAWRDAVLPARHLRRTVAMVAGGAEPSDPRLSPLFAGFENAPPVLIHYSTDEILRDDAARMADVLARDGVEVVARAVPGMPHVWHFYPEQLAEARDSLAELSAFIRERAGPEKAGGS